MKDHRIILEKLKNQIIEASTYNNVDDRMIEEYSNLRNEILSKYSLMEKLPKCLKTCSTLSQVRNYFQIQASGYKARRELIDKEFENCLEFNSKTIDFEDVVDKIEKNEFNFLPEEIKEKGREMTSVFYVLYCIENSLRIFIDKTFVEKFGIDYQNEISVPTSIRKTIKMRKDQETKNAWLSIRGESDLFYMDFKELGDVVLNNWETFKDSFPDQAWIKIKIDELGNCRNLIAHNSYVGEHERDVIKVNYRSIVKQISK
jgi:hypothetical protein